MKLYLVPAKTSEDKVKNLETIRLATEVKNRRILELASGELKVEAPKKNSNVLAVDYFQKKIKSIKTINSRKTNESMIKSLKEFRKNAILAEIDRDFYQRFIDFLLYGKKLANASARGYAKLFKARLHDAYIDGLIAKMPDLQGITPKKESTEVDFLTLEELKALAETEAPDYVKKPFLFCCFTGLRFSDVQSLKWEDIENGTIILKMKKTKEFVRIPLSENAKRLMPKSQEKGTVFKTISLQGTGKRLKTWATKAGVKKNLHFHVSRHTFGTLTLENGADIYTVSKLLGHRSIVTTQIYAKVLDEGRKKAVDAIPLI